MEHFSFLLQLIVPITCLSVLQILSWYSNVTTGGAVFVSRRRVSVASYLASVEMH